MERQQGGGSASMAEAARQEHRRHQHQSPPGSSRHPLRIRHLRNSAQAGDTNGLIRVSLQQLRKASRVSHPNDRASITPTYLRQ